MRRICYQVACSLDGYLAARGGDVDWIPADPEIDFEALAFRSYPSRWRGGAWR